ncbi:hypothetical protein ACWD4N_47085, partial [Streptomyces sp. NPDC002586]
TTTGGCAGSDAGRYTYMVRAPGRMSTANAFDSWIGTTYLTEFDLVEVGDDAAIGPYVSLQTHLFEDRVMKMSTVTVGPGASVGARTVVLYDGVVGAGVRLGALSLVMKGEHLPVGTDWQGLPVEGCAGPAVPPVTEPTGKHRP